MELLECYNMEFHTNAQLCIRNAISFDVEYGSTAANKPQKKT